MKNIVCFGEVLWDIFPNHKKIGGAPLNVALRLQSLGNNLSIITSVGKDIEGEEILNLIDKKGINRNNVQIDETLKTGTVQVTLDTNGAASYIINSPRAWDNIKLTNTSKEITKNADVFIFGSLVARDSTSRTTLFELLKLANYKIFDVNLRTPHYTKDLLSYLMKTADFIKFNDEEIIEIAAELGFKKDSLEEIIQFIAKETNTKSICVTKGSNGAILYYNDTFYYNTGYKITVVDTVGAGDSFLASLIDKLINDSEPQNAIDYACAVGALVASKEGANPEINKQEIEDFIKTSPGMARKRNVID